MSDECNEDISCTCSVCVEIKSKIIKNAGTTPPPHKLPGTKFQAGIVLEFPRALRAVAEAGAFGNNVHGYTRGSWKQVENGVEVFTDAMMRHVLAEQIEQIDFVSGLPAAAHTAWNALARLELMLQAAETEGSINETETETE